MSHGVCLLVLPFENIHVSQKCWMKNSNKKYRMVKIRENDCWFGNDFDFEEKDNQTHSVIIQKETENIQVSIF